MTYTSLNFIFFVLATALVYFVLPFKKYRWTVLLAASIFFYCTWSYQLGAFMLFTTLSTYLIALWLNRVSVKSKAVLKEHKSEWSRDDKKKYKNKTKVRMRLVMTLALLLNFGILAFLKYYNFFAGRNHAAQLAIVKQMSRQESRSSPGNSHADQPAGITQLSRP